MRLDELSTMVREYRAMLEFTESRLAYYKLTGQDPPLMLVSSAQIYRNRLEELTRP